MKGLAPTPPATRMIGSVGVVRHVEAADRIAEGDGIAWAQVLVDEGGRQARRDILARWRRVVLDDEVEIRRFARRGCERVGAGNAGVFGALTLVECPQIGDRGA